MPNISSQAKRDRQNARRRQHNKSLRNTTRTYVKRFDAAAEKGEREAAEIAYRVAARELDKAASKGVLHRNFAANKKSQMARRLSALS